MDVPTFNGPLKNYRLKKRKQKYLKPKTSFTDRIWGEVPNNHNKGWDVAECIGLDARNDFIVLKKGAISICSHFRVPMFSANNPPPKGAKFVFKEWESDFFKRFSSIDGDDNSFLDEIFHKRSWKDAIWIDFETVEG